MVENSTPISLQQFEPGKLPGNQYAFTNMIYVSQQAYGQFVEESGKEPVYVKVKNFVLRLSQLHTLGPKEFAASSLQKEAMRIAKIDTVSMEPVRVRETNPLCALECSLDMVHMDPDCDREVGKAVVIEQDEILKAVAAAFDGKFINYGEQFPLALKEGKLIVKVKVNRLEPLKSQVSQTWGTVDEQTIVKCKVGQNSAALLKFATNEVK